MGRGQLAQPRKRKEAKEKGGGNMSVNLVLLLIDLCLKLCYKSFYKTISWDFPGGAVVKNPPANAGDTGSSPGPGRSHMPQSN